MSADSNYSQQPVPLAARKSALALSVVMLGLTFFSASMWTGGTLGTGLSYDDFFLAVLLGNLMLGLYTAILGFIGARTGLSTHLLAHYSFGSKGSWLPSALLGGTQVGWFGVGVAMFAIPVAKATGLDVNLLILVSGALMTLTVFFGIAGLTLLSAIAVPAIVVLGSYSVWLAGPRHPRRALAVQPLRRLADLPLRRHPAHRRGDHRRLPESPPALPPAPLRGHPGDQLGGDPRRRLRHRRRPLAAGDRAGQRGARRRHRLPAAQSPAEPQPEQTRRGPPC